MADGNTAGQADHGDPHGMHGHGGAMVDMMVMAVMPATVPEPCATRKIKPMEVGKGSTLTTEPVPMFRALMGASPMLVAAITLPKEPPAPVMASATPAVPRALLAEASGLLAADVLPGHDVGHQNGHEQGEDLVAQQGDRQKNRREHRWPEAQS